MKRFTRIIGAVCMMGLLTFVSTSCKKNQENDETTINVVVSGLEEEGERAYITEYCQFFWHENDYIRVYNLADEENAVESTTAVYTKIGNVSAQTARFRGPSVGPKKAEGYRYFFPVYMVKGDNEEVCTNLWNQNRQVFQVSDHQYYESYETTYHHFSLVDGLAMPMTVAVDKLTDDATLKHLFGTASFRLSAAPGTTVVVDSIKLVDHYHNISGDFSLKLHKFRFEDYLDAWNQYFNEYQCFTDEYYQNVILPLYESWGYYDFNGFNSGYAITLNCIFEHEDGTINGVQLMQYPNMTAFNFMLRPLALSEGFNLTLYFADGNVIELSDADFVHHDEPLNYTWAVKPGKIKSYIMNYPINYDW